MNKNPLHDLEQCGQSVWVDSISRQMLDSGQLQRFVDQDGIGGVTSNPTIFQKAIAGSSDYDDDLRKYSDQSMSADQVFERLAASDVQRAADVLRPVYDRTHGADGFVSIEVSPQAAHDLQRTLDDAHTLWGLVDRPNVMIKVPATPEGIPAIEQLLSEGLNVNITLIFAVEVYEQVMEAYLRGLERHAEAGHAIDHIASVASFFVSRVDTLVDQLLQDKAKNASGDEKQRLESLEGKAAIANAKIAYERFEQIFGGDRFKKLEAKGARVQRPLWASTSTKNPKYPDTLYVDALVGKNTVDTMPVETIDAVRDHGKITCGTLQQDVQGAHQVMKDLASVGIDMKEVTDQLTREGVQKFTDSLLSLLKTIEEQQGAVASR